MKRKSKLLAIFLCLVIGNLVFANWVFAAGPQPGTQRKNPW